MFNWIDNMEWKIWNSIIHWATTVNRLKFKVRNGKTDIYLNGIKLKGIKEYSVYEDTDKRGKILKLTIYVSGSIKIFDSNDNQSSNDNCS